MIKQDFIKPTISFNKNCHYKDYKLGEVLDLSVFIPKCAILISVIVYLIFHIIQCRHIQDERENLIKHKAFKFSQRLTTTCLLLLAITNFFYKEMSINFVLSTLIFSALYSEIIGSIFFRRRY